MSFGEKLRKLMSELGLSQTEVADLVGVGKSSISQYLSGKNEPFKERQKEIARALGVQEDYFDVYDTEAADQYDECINLPVAVAAKLMHKSHKWVEKGLQDGVFNDWGRAVKLDKWSYWISSVKFEEITGIKIPRKDNR